MLIIGKRPFKVRLDPMGYFRVTLDGKDILVEHRFEDVTLKEYRGKKAERLQHEIARDVALSDINHAIYLGRQLARAESGPEGRPGVCAGVDSYQLSAVSFQPTRAWRSESVGWHCPPSCLGGHCAAILSYLAAGL